MGSEKEKEKNRQSFLIAPNTISKISQQVRKPSFLTKIVLHPDGHQKVTVNFCDFKTLGRFFLNMASSNENSPDKHYGVYTPPRNDDLPEDAEALNKRQLKEREDKTTYEAKLRQRIMKKIQKTNL